MELNGFVRKVAAGFYFGKPIDQTLGWYAGKHAEIQMR